MAIQRLSLSSFRNHRNISLTIKPGITIFTGTNGMGKTSILEAISILGTGKSFRLGKNEDFILRGEETGHLVCDVEQSGLSNTIKMEIHPQGKRVYLDDKYIRKMSGVSHLLPSVVFSPGDHKIIEGDSTDRKSFLNRAASVLDYSYADILTAYNRVLTQRNQLLKKISKENISYSQAAEFLDVWDEQLLEHGLALIERRRSYIDDLKEKITHEYQQIAGSKDIFAARYCALGDEEENTENSVDIIGKKLRNSLKDSMRRDLIFGTTSDGPHKDEILLTLNGNKVKFYGSQGEKRTCALALRLGEVSLFKEKQKRAPVLLIDDVSSELDSQRRKSLVDLLQKEDAQVLITATELPSTLMQDLGKSFAHIDLGVIGEGK